ncbi:MAG: hypothetical protein QNJ74_13540, partial [Trichodesmium sp. MO_231.B1]|nr:hypothetical protein [Trichodesmium sp. MO_231.B1]
MDRQVFYPRNKLSKIEKIKDFSKNALHRCSEYLQNLRMGTTYSAKNYNAIVFELYIYGLCVSPN